MIDVVVTRSQSDLLMRFLLINSFKHVQGVCICTASLSRVVNLSYCKRDARVAPEKLVSDLDSKSECRVLQFLKN